MDIDDNVVNTIPVYTDPICLQGLKGCMHSRPIVDDENV